MPDGGTEWQRAKRDQLEQTVTELAAARAELDETVERSRRMGDQGDDLEVIGPISLEISSLRRLADRLGHELDAIDAEWAA
jgi:type VI protein secretion system component VasF